MSVRKIAVASKPLSRSIHLNRPLAKDAQLEKLKQWQEFFQKPDDVPVYLKRGLTDRLLVGFITIGTFVGLGNSFKFLYEEMIKP